MYLVQQCYRWPSSSVKGEGLSEGLLQPDWQAGGHLRWAPIEHGRHHLHLREALVGQLASRKVQNAGGKAPHICVSAAQAKFSVHLLWSPTHTHTSYNLGSH